MTGRLAILKLYVPCFAAGSPEATRDLGDRAVRALRDHFPQSARACLAPWLDRADVSLWIVRRVELAMLLSAEAPADVIASSAAIALARALGDTLVDEGDGLNAIRFEDRAAYVASFVTDAAWGDAWSRWYYAPLLGLKPLPTSAAIRTVLIEDPAVGRQALKRLDTPALARVASALASQDEALVLDVLANAAGEDAADAAVSRAWSEYRRQLHAAPGQPSLIVTFIRAPTDGAGASFLRALRRLHSVLEILRRTRPRQLAHAPGSISAVEAMIDDFGASTEVPRDILRDMMAHLASPRPATSHDAGGTHVTTPFGGLLLLLRELDDMPPLQSGPTLATKWLTVAMCAGRARSEAVLHDEVLRNLFGIPGVSLAEVARCLRDTRPRANADDRLPSRDRDWLSFDRRVGIAPAWGSSLALEAHRALRAFARRIPGFAEASAAYLWENFLSGDASLEYEDHRIIVRCGRPPLHLMLTLTGMTRGLEAGHDAQDRPVIVFARD